MPTAYLADTGNQGAETPWWVSLLAWTRRREQYWQGLGWGADF